MHFHMSQLKLAMMVDITNTNVVRRFHLSRVLPINLFILARLTRQPVFMYTMCINAPWCIQFFYEMRYRAINVRTNRRAKVSVENPELCLIHFRLLINLVVSCSPDI